jgi:hypothetical protein
MSRGRIARSVRSVGGTVIRTGLAVIFLGPLYIALAEVVHWLKFGVWPYWTLPFVQAVLPVEAHQWLHAPKDWLGLHAIARYLVTLPLSLFAVVCYVAILVAAVVVVLLLSGTRKSTHVTRYG